MSIVHVLKESSSVCMGQGASPTAVRLSVPISRVLVLLMATGQLCPDTWSRTERKCHRLAR